MDASRLLVRPARTFRDIRALNKKANRMTLIPLVLTVAALAWQYGPNELVFQADSSGWLHAYRNGVDMGRAASGTVITGWGMVFVPDSIFSNKFGG